MAQGFTFFVCVVLKGDQKSVWASGITAAEEGEMKDLVVAKATKEENAIYSNMIRQDWQTMELSGTKPLHWNSVFDKKEKKKRSSFQEEGVSRHVGKCTHTSSTMT